MKILSSTAGLFLVLLLCNEVFLMKSFLANGSNSTFTCIAKERQALLKFKQSLNDTKGRLSSWTGEDCCNWKGIQCNINGHVVKLVLIVPIAEDLFGFNFEIESSEVNPSLLELKYLEHLGLSGIGFRDTPIPIFIGSMLSLRYLNLSHSQFSGMVPHHLGNLTNLRVLDLSYEFPGQLAIDDFTWVSGLSSLQYLDVSGANLTQARNVDKVLNMLPSLTELHLKECELGSNRLVSRIHLNSTSNLRYLDLSWNSFAGEFPGFIANMTTLRVLDLYSISLNTSIPAYLENLKSLEHLNLGGNSIIDCLPDWVGQFKLLKYLDLSLTSFTGQIPASLGQLKLLEYVDLSSNSFTGQIPVSLGQLKLLKYLDLSMNSFTGQIPASLGQLKLLKHLDLSANSFTGQIPASLGQLKLLKHLDLSHNSLTGQIPASLGQLSSLEVLDMSSNHLEGVVTEAHFANLSMLQELKVSSKFFFRRQRVSSNLLTLKVKSDWIPPFQLKIMRMGSCKIGADFPQWLHTQRKVVELDLSNASMSGTLPEWLHEMPLSWLDLSQNQISGPIQRLPSTLQELHLSHNLISGPISRNIDVMVPTLDTLLLGSNLINGSIPDSLFGIRTLLVLDLSRNRLSGNIPRYQGEFSVLHVMILSSNRLSGVIPSSISNFNELEWLHLNNNSLHGKLPLTLRNCTRLEVLDIGENGFSGNIPRWIGEFQYLSILRLHKNMFSGSIPSEICQLSRIQIKDLGDNFLRGTIPHCIGNFTGMILDESRSQLTYPINLRTQWSEETMMQVIKGRQLEYFAKTLVFLANMDLSRNNMVGTIPEEITVLSRLCGLNLSHNNLTGIIPKKIGGLKSLESLDFSSNQLSGIIPQSMSDLKFISHLNLSYNNLWGRIPTGNQLQTLNDPSCYVGNSDLCGDPLPRKCPGDEPPQSPTTAAHEEEWEGDEAGEFWFYMVIASGYATGLWGVLGVLILKRNWRHAFFQFVDMIKEKVLLAVALGVARLKKYVSKVDG